MRGMRKRVLELRMEENVNEDAHSCGRNRWKEPRGELQRKGRKEGR